MQGRCPGGREHPGGGGQHAPGQRERTLPGTRGVHRRKGGEPALQPGGDEQPFVGSQAHVITISTSASTSWATSLGLTVTSSSAASSWNFGGGPAGSKGSWGGKRRSRSPRASTTPDSSMADQRISL